MTTKNTYFIKVLMLRSMLAIQIATCYFLVKNDLMDYVILITLIIIFLGSLSVSFVEVTGSSVLIKKHYFWATAYVNLNLKFNEISSITTKDYQIDHQPSDWFADHDFISWFVLHFLEPKIKWFTTKITYCQKGVEKDIELRLHREIYKEIAWKVK